MADELYTLHRKAGTILARILTEGKIINDKYVGPGNVEVVAGVLGEQYWLTPETAIANYADHPEFVKALKRANDGKL